MKRLFLFPALYTPMLIYSCKQQGAVPPLSSNTASNQKPDSSYTTPGDTTKGSKKYTIPPGVTKIDDVIGWSISLDKATHLVNAEKGNFSYAYAKWAEDTTYFQFDFSNINRYTVIDPPIDTTGKLAIRIYRTDGKNLRTGIRDV